MPTSSADIILIFRGKKAKKDRDDFVADPDQNAEHQPDLDVPSPSAYAAKVHFEAEADPDNPRMPVIHLRGKEHAMLKKLARDLGFKTKNKP